MNKAARSILLWFFDREEVSEEEAKELVETLARGAEKREEDSLSAIAYLLSLARQAAVGSRDEALIDRLWELHGTLTVLDNAEKKIDALASIRAILENPAGNAMAKRVQQLKVSGIVKATLAAGTDISAS